MATLDEKILDGPNVGYCSDSEDEQAAGDGFRRGCDAELQGSSSVISPRTRGGGGMTTGPKGVLADYHQFECNRLAEKRKAEAELLKAATRLTLEKGSNVHSSDEDDDDDDLAAIRKRRLEQLKCFSRGRILEIPDTGEFLAITEGSAVTRGVFAVVHIYRDGLDAVRTVNEALLELAAKYVDSAKFYKVKADVLGTSKNFSENGLPALQIYRNGELIGNFVRITDELGDDFSATQLYRFFEKRDIDIADTNL